MLIFLHFPCFFFFFFNDTATTEIYTLSLHDALPIFAERAQHPPALDLQDADERERQRAALDRFVGRLVEVRDRKSTRLNSSHTVISYAVFCLKKKKSPLCSLDAPSQGCSLYHHPSGS